MTRAYALPFLRQSTSGADHGKRPPKFNQDCTICRSCRWHGIPMNRPKMAGMRYGTAGI